MSSLLIVRLSAAAQWQKEAIFDTPQKAMSTVQSALWERIMPDEDIYISGPFFPRFAVLPIVHGSRSRLRRCVGDHA